MLQVHPNVAVDVHCGTYVGVPQYLSHNGWMAPVPQMHSGAGVAEHVRSRVSDPSRFSDSLELPVEDRLVSRRPILGGED